MAKPWKAICDYIFCYKKRYDDFDSFLENLRIYRENLIVLRDEEIDRLNDYYQHSRISHFLETVSKFQYDHK